jgi:hypothetical protein
MIEGATANQSGMIIQLDDYTNDRGQQLGQVLSAVSGLTSRSSMTRYSPIISKPKRMSPMI